MLPTEPMGDVVAGLEDGALEMLRVWSFSIGQAPSVSHSVSLVWVDCCG